MSYHDKKGYNKERLCEIFNKKGRFYLLESIEDEQDAIDFYIRVLERGTNIFDDEDTRKIEHIIADEEEHKRLFKEILNKLKESCPV